MNVSKMHARLIELPGGRCRIEDNQSMNGVFVNGVKVIMAELKATTS